MTLRPMLAKPFEVRYIKEEGYIQPKLDGVRLIWTGSEALSRSGKPILGMPKLIEHLKANYAGFPLDGELYKHGSSFQSFLGSIRKTKNIEEDESVCYHVYDHPIPDVPFAERHQILVKRLVETDRIKLVKTVMVIAGLPKTKENHQTIMKALNRFEELGYEGTMWRNADGLYAFGKRSADLVKVKTFEEEEFEVVGVKEKLTYDKVIVPANTPGAKPYSDNGDNAGLWYKDENPRPVGTLGALVCKLPNGETVDVGSGYDDETRDAFWKNPPIGKIATVKYFELTDDGIPRFPVFKAIRDYE